MFVTGIMVSKSHHNYTTKHWDSQNSDRRYSRITLTLQFLVFSFKLLQRNVRKRHTHRQTDKYTHMTTTVYFWGSTHWGIIMWHHMTLQPTGKHDKRFVLEHGWHNIVMDESEWIWRKRKTTRNMKIHSSTEHTCRGTEHAHMYTHTCTRWIQDIVGRAFAS